MTKLSKIFISAENLENIVWKCKIAAEYSLRILNQELDKKNLCRTICRLRVYSKFILRFATNLYMYLFKGCFEFPLLCPKHFPNKNRIDEKNETGCYLECQKENSTCRQNEPVYFALKVMFQIILLSVNAKFQYFYILEKKNIQR